MKSDIVQVLKEITDLKDISLDIPLPQFGDYSTNVAMTLFASLQLPDSSFQSNSKLQSSPPKSPRELAEEIKNKLLEDKELTKLVEKIEIAGPGFINFYINKEALASELESVIAKGERYGYQDQKEDIVLVEYSAPNIAKRFSIGHLRSTIIGDAIKNLYEVLGYKVIGENHLGDWGTQFGMIIAQIVRKGLDARTLSVEELESLYVEFNSEMKENPELRSLAKEWFKKLEGGDSEAREIWQTVKETSLIEFKRIYDMLDVHIENAHGESFYEDKMPDVIEAVKASGISEVGEGGAVIVPFDGMAPGMLLKSDGTTTYFTRDLAAFDYRVKTWNPSVLIYEVGSDQVLHFRQLFCALEKLGWSSGKTLKHVAHGLVRFEHGKMSTRRGETIKLEDILTEAVQRSRSIIEKSETNRGLTNVEIEELSHVIGVGAVKYFDLSHSPTSDIIFDWDKIIALEGNSGPYIQYTYARTQSVLGKIGKEKAESRNISHFSSFISDLTLEELTILRHIIHYGEVLEEAAISYSPNLLCNYLYELAQKFNSFYSSNKIIGSENEAFRIELTKATGIILKNGLSILGIKAPEKM
jgi:arginyl-tRNA synthetase